MSFTKYSSDNDDDESSQTFTKGDKKIVVNYTKNEISEAGLYHCDELVRTSKNVLVILNWLSGEEDHAGS